MTYPATVYRVLIASPSDVLPERKAVSEALYAWNALNSVTTKIVLLPIMWETHAAPEMGKRPQEIINKQLVKECDLLIGTFWTRIGTHTGAAESGTVEEIREFLNAGKPVMIYFSSAPVVPDSIDPDQYKKLVEFRDDCKKKGLVEWYESVGDFREKLTRQITIRLREIHGSHIYDESSVTMTVQKADNDVGNMLAEQLKNAIRHIRVEWDTERNSEPININDGKIILQNLSDTLIEFRGAFSDRLDKSVIAKIDEVITNAKILQKHELYLDGGVSYKDFWEKGDRQFHILDGVLDSVANLVAQDDPSRLDAGSEAILVLLARHEEQGGKYIQAGELAKALSLSIVKVTHTLEELARAEYVHDLLTANMPTQYALEAKGRKYLVGRDLV